MSLSFHFHGHGTYTVNVDGVKLLIDPFFTHNPVADVSAKKV